METPASISQWATHAGNVELHASVAHRRSHCAALSLLPVTGTLVSSAGASQKPLTPLTIIHVRGSRWSTCWQRPGVRSHHAFDFFDSVDATSFALALCAGAVLARSLTGTIDSIQFANARDGYAIVGATGPTSLFVTLNGARTWHRVVVKRCANARPTTATNAIYAITVLLVQRHDCGDYHIARSRSVPIDGPVGKCYRPFREDRVWDSPMFRLPTAARYGSPSNLRPRRHLLLPR